MSELKKKLLDIIYDEVDNFQRAMNNGKLYTPPKIPKHLLKWLDDALRSEIMKECAIEVDKAKTGKGFALTPTYQIEDESDNQSKQLSGQES